MCGRKGSFADSILGTTTYTRRGAVRVLKRELAEGEAKLGRILAGDGLTFVDSRPAGMSWQEAEVLVQKWMRRNGYPDAVLTASGADGGIDVMARKAIGQVKHHSKPVGIREVQRMAGIAVPLRKKALVFAATGFTAPALTWAKANGVKCYAYPPVKLLT